MNNGATTQIEALTLLCLPRSSSTQWDPTTAKIGLQQLRRLRGEIASLEAVLVGVMKTETGRDTKATLARGFGMSNAEAHKAEIVADIVTRVVGAGEALADGSVTGEHLRHLKLIKDNDQAAELLALAPSQSPDDFAKTVTQYLIDRDSKGVREHHHRHGDQRDTHGDDRHHASRNIRMQHPRRRTDPGRRRPQTRQRPPDRYLRGDPSNRRGDHELRPVTATRLTTPKTRPRATRRRNLCETGM